MASSTAGFPRALTTFIGRGQEAASVHALLLHPDVRLVTLTGPGGVGKTRLALHVVANLADSFNERWFVPLSPIRDPALVAPSIAERLGVTRSSGRSVEEDLGDFLRDRNALLVLDNFEHVAAAAEVVTDLLLSCPQLVMLITSRSRLRISGEHVFSVPPLALVDTVDHDDLDQLMTVEAVQLFVDRAQASAGQFTLTANNARAVVEICTTLEGLPLAIELAAAHSGLLTPSQLLAQLENQLSLLTHGPRDQPLRLQTMRAAISWSYDLLSPEEQTLLRHLSVFTGGFTLEAAEALATRISNASEIAPHPPDRRVQDATLPSPLSTLESLVNHSMIRRYIPHHDQGGSRFIMLEMIREFAQEHLEATGEALTVRAAHAETCLAIVREGEAHLLRDVDPAWLDRLEAEHNNIRSALAWCFDPARSSSDTIRGVQIAGSLWLFWYYHSHLTEGRLWLERALSVATAIPDRDKAMVLIGLGTLTHYQGDKARASTALNEALTLFRQLDDRWNIAFALTACGNLAEDEGRYDEAIDRFTEANALFAETEDQVNVAVTLYHLGVVAFGQGNLALAAARCEEGLGLARASADPWTVAGALGYLGLVQCARGQLDTATAALGEALTIYRRIGSQERITEIIRRIGMLVHLRGSPEAALRLFSAAETLGNRIGVHAELPEVETYDRALAEIRNTLPGGVHATQWTAGQTLSLSEAITEAEGALATRSPGTASRSAVSDVPTRSSLYGLSRRELEVLRLLVEGKTNTQIATVLFISRRTAATHVQHVYDKLGVSSRAEAAAIAVRHNLVQ